VNRLSEELSPYLRQHADNPVDWFPWGESAFQAAKDLNKPILLSVGYSACHWCHVMAHESFEDEATAAVMNELFVNVKVDREERPDVDAIYMAAVTAMTGHGGWPMTVFLTPDGAPFFAGTYFPPKAQGNRPSFKDVMEQVNRVWHERQADVLTQSKQIVAALKSSIELTSEAAPSSPHLGYPAKQAPLDQAVSTLKARYDPAWGGFGMAPKFPQTMNLELLLRQYWHLGDTDLLHMVENSFDCMSSGGIYDHLGGGFARYSVDRQWLVPHFEKMLYDNALLARLALHLWQITRKPRYLQVLEETISYVLSELHHPAGGFYSAQDADSEGEEGKYYVWSASEFTHLATAALGGGSQGLDGEGQKLILPAGSQAANSQDSLAHDLAAATRWYGVTEEGNFESHNILWRPQRGDLLRPEKIETVRQALLEARSQRVPPGLDDKVLTEWNALMLSTLAEAAAATQNQSWLAAAVANAEFLCDNLKDPQGRWLRVWQDSQNSAHSPSGAGVAHSTRAAGGAETSAGAANFGRAGRARYLAYAADYAALLDAFTRVYEATGRKKWLTEACLVADQMLDLFWDSADGSLFTVGSDAEQLIIRAKDFMDNSQPSANSAACFGLLRLSSLTSNENYRQKAARILENSLETAEKAPSAFGHLLGALDFSLQTTQEIVISGDLPDLVNTIQQRYLPNSVLSWGEPTGFALWEGRQDTAAAYVCSFGVCQAPATTAAELEAALEAALTAS